MIITRADLDLMPEPYCARGTRRWAARVGVDWSAFVRAGIDADILLATGDAMALRLVEHVRARRAAEADHGV